MYICAYSQAVISRFDFTARKPVVALPVRQNLVELLNEVQYRHGNMLITKAGKPVAALVDIAMYTRLRKLDEEFDRMRAELAQALAGRPVSGGAGGYAIPGRCRGGTGRGIR